jgi:hypothetical protein
MASLDIGFSRSNTQVALMEIPAGYDRGHLTEYSALYTSLSTAYRVELDNESSQALPFPSKPRGLANSDETPIVANLDKATSNELSGLQIQSNTTELVHAEHMFGIGGGIRIQQNEAGETILINDSSIRLKNVLVVGGVKLKPTPRDDSTSTETDGNKAGKKMPKKIRQVSYQFAVVEALDPKTQIKITFDDSPDVLTQYRSDRLMLNSRRSAAKLWHDWFGGQNSVAMQSLAEVDALSDRWDDYSNAILMRQQATNESNVDQEVVDQETFLDVYEQINPTPYVSLGKMFDCIFDNLQMDAGDFRLFGTTDRKIGQTKIYPDSTQSDRQTLIVAHLTYPKLPEVGRDTNSVADLKSISDLDRKKLELFND